MAAPVLAMVGRGVFIALAGLVLSGCCLWPAQQEFACPDVTRASAWVNRMPGPGRTSAPLHVALRLDDRQSWMLAPEETGKPGILSLSLAPGGPSVPGTAGYRQAAPNPLPDEIRIRCQGRTIAVIDEITVAQ